MTSQRPGKDTPERRKDERLPAKEIGAAVELKSLVPDRKSSKGELVNVSSGGIAIWLLKELDKGSHWLLTMPDLEDAGIPVKLLHARPGFGGFIHSFKFSTHQATLADRLGWRKKGLSPW